jgi:2-methylisocitrate lyase-like PEP mutase family enzyme
MSLRARLQGALPVTAPLVLNPLMARMAEAAGFAAIEIEDQLVPKRAHHHVGIEHMIPIELMAAKVKEAVAARRSPDFLIVGRTNAMRASDMDDALRRGEAYRRAGADLVLKDLGGLGYKIVADPSTPLLAAFVAWKKVYADLAQDFGSAQPKVDRSPVEHEMLTIIDIEKLLADERATVEKAGA